MANSLVFHLHGHTEPESLVLIEDDYLDFLDAMLQGGSLLPAPVERALRNSSFLFIGYRLADRNFRILFHALRPTIQHNSFAVLLPPQGPDQARDRARDYLNKYYAPMGIKIYWGTSREFAAELRQRWNGLKAAGSGAVA